MPKRIPIAAARRIAEQHDCRQVILVAWDEGGRTHVVTYGKTLQDCAQAAAGGNFVKRALGWPEALSNDVPARSKRGAPSAAGAAIHRAPLNDEEA
jgi:hypothetical protein